MIAALLISVSVAGRGYFLFLPQAPALYPDSYEEAKAVILATEQRSASSVELFHKTDLSVSAAFIEILDEPIEEIAEIAFRISPLILCLKCLANRPRPHQVAPQVKGKMLLASITAATPSFPSGHSAQASFVAQHYSTIYPEKKKVLFDMAENIGRSRVDAGLHYPSDHDAAKKLVSLMF
jgi:membrane-associated phospholipid phosphatase